MVSKTTPRSTLRSRCSLSFTRTYQRSLLISHPGSSMSSESQRCIARSSPTTQILRVNSSRSQSPERSVHIRRLRVECSNIGVLSRARATAHLAICGTRSTSTTESLSTEQFKCQLSRPHMAVFEFRCISPNTSSRWSNSVNRCSCGTVSASLKT